MQAAIFGPGWAGSAALLITGVGIAMAWWRGRKPSLLLVLVSAVLLLAPVLPLLLFAFPNGLDRVVFLLAWACAVFVVWQFEKLHWRGLGIGLLFAALAIGQWLNGRTTERHQRLVMALNDFMIHGRAIDKLVAVDFANVGLLRSIRDAAQLITGRSGPAVVGSEEEFIALGSQSGRASWSWQVDCECIRQMGPRYDSQTADLHRRWVAGQALPLQVHVELNDAGRIKTIHWRVDGSKGQAHIEVYNELRLDLARQGTIAFGLDTTFWPTDPAQIRFVVTTAQQSTVYSPWLSLPLSRSSVIDWSGLGSAPPALK